MKKLSAFLVLLGLLAGFGSVCSAAEKTYVKIGGNVKVEEGMTVKNAVAIWGDVTVNGIVEQDAVSIGGSVTLGPRAQVGRNVVSIKGTVNKDPRARINGNITEIGHMCISGAGPCCKGKYFFGKKILMFFGFLALALLFVAIFQKLTQNITVLIDKNILKSFIWGIIGSLLIVPVGFLLLISLIGIVLIPLEIIFVALAMLIGYFIFARFSGRKIVLAFKFRETSVLFETFLGLLVLGLIGLIPFLGFLVMKLAAVTGFGGVLIAFYNSVKK
ncbi:MAG: hypothetical protein NT145_05830 [Elusimicrobia bacterium]|nr:hypothetical protein [Elusimicrobiota bacterium]